MRENKEHLLITSALATLLALACNPARGDVTYTLHFTPSSSPEAQQVANSVAEAVGIINLRGSFNKHWDVYYNSGIPTAEANYNGYMGFGGTRNTRVVFHEGAHTFGMGTLTVYANLIAGGVWRGQYGQQAAQETYGATLNGDGHAIWPGGFNYDNEDGFIQRIWMLRVMAGIRADMGIISFTREAENEVANVGETAEFMVEAPVAGSYQWYKNGALLSNGGDISGSTSATLRIANAEAADEGSYHCVATGALSGETLASRPRQLWVDALPQLVQLNLDGNVSDSVNTHPGIAYGSPAYAAGKIGQAIDLDGVNDYIALSADAVRAKEITVATWVNWDGGNNWQRIFDFGTGEDQYMFLTPKSGSGTLRLAFKDRVYGLGTEQIIDTTVLPSAQWVHLAAVLNDDYATLYVNGQPVGSTFGIRTRLSNFLPMQNYIGKSQYSDPLFNGRIDDFRVYNHALDGSEIWDLWGQSDNAAPVFTTNLVILPSAFSGEAYAAPSLTNHVHDADGDTLAFAKIDGPAWLSVAANGTLSGTPPGSAEGLNSFVVRVKDPSGASSDAELQINVVAPPPDYESGPVLYWDFADAGAVAGGWLPGNGDRIDLDSDGAMDFDDFRIGAVDRSGNGNHLTAWTSSWMKWSADSLQGDFSMTSGNSYPAAGTDSAYNPHLTGIDAEAISPTNWTVEVIFKSSNLTDNRTMVGRDGRIGGNAAALYFSTRGTALAIEYRDVDGAGHNLQVAAGLATNTWYTAAATSDGTTLRLYLNGSQIGSLDLTTTGTDTALGLGYGTWSVARGIWAGEHTDRFFGFIDAVAISGVTLSPGSFVTETFGKSGFDLWAEGYGIPGASFEEDWNTNGIPNGMEYYLGWDPTDPSPPHSILSWTNDYLSVVHPFNPSAEGVAGSVEWTTDLMSGNWFSGGVSYVTNSDPDEIEAWLETATTNDALFIRLKVQH